MAYEDINNGTVEGDNTGEGLFTAWAKVKRMFTELYTREYIVRGTFNNSLLDVSSNLIITTPVNFTDFDLSITDDQGSKKSLGDLIKKTGNRQITIYMYGLAPLPGTWRYILKYYTT